MSIYKYQEGMTAAPQISPEMLSEAMSAQGAGQGIDYNGNPTPNVSGAPSFADMAQEIHDRYDKLIIPLQQKLEKLQKKLEENPSDQTIKNEMKRLEQRIDHLEQQEDMELQQLEAEVERTGQQIEQEKQIENGIGMPVPEGDVPEYQPLAEQQMPQEEEMPMMQTGSVHKAQIGEKISDWWKHTVVPAFTRDMGFEAPFASDDPHPYNLEDFTRDYNQAMKENPVISRVVQWNPILGGAAAVANLFSQIKGYRNDNEFLNNIQRGAMGLIPIMPVSAGWNGIRGLVGYMGLKAATNAMVNERNRSLSDMGYAVQQTPYTGGFSGYMNEKYGLPTWAGELGAMLYGGNKMFMKPGTLYSGGGAAGTVSSRMEKALGMKWKDIKKQFEKDTGNKLGDPKVNEDFAKAVEEGKIYLYDDGRGNKVFVDRRVPAEPEYKPQSAAPENANNAVPSEQSKDYSNMTDKELLHDIGKASLSGFEKGWNAYKNTLANVRAKTANQILYPFGELLQLRRTSDPLSGKLSYPFNTSKWKNIYSEMPSINKDFWSNKIPQSKILQTLNILGNTTDAGLRMGLELGIPYSMYLNKKFEREEEEVRKQQIQEAVEEFETGTLTPAETYNGAVTDGGEQYDPKKDSTLKENQEELINFPSQQTEGKVNLPKKAEGGETETWYDSLLKQYDEKHPKGFKGYIESTPVTQHVLMGSMLGNLLDNSARNNIEAQHQFKYSSNPYTYMYDKLNRDYHDQLRSVNMKFDIDDMRLEREKTTPQYGSIQQANNARLAQSLIDNANKMTNMSSRITALNNIENAFGKPVNEAMQNMREQDYRNVVINENENKSYLSAIDKYNKEKRQQYANIMEMIALAGKEQKRNDMFYDYAKNYINGAKLGVDYNMLKAILSPLMLQEQKSSQARQNSYPVYQ